MLGNFSTLCMKALEIFYANGIYTDIVVWFIWLRSSPLSIIDYETNTVVNPIEDLMKIDLLLVTLYSATKFSCKLVTYMQDYNSTSSSKTTNFLIIVLKQIFIHGKLLFWLIHLTYFIKDERGRKLDRGSKTCTLGARYCELLFSKYFRQNRYVSLRNYLMLQCIASLSR